MTGTKNGGRVYQAEGTAHAECLEAKQSRSYPADHKTARFDEAGLQEPQRGKGDQKARELGRRRGKRSVSLTEFRFQPEGGEEPPKGMIRVVIPKGNSGILARCGFQDQAGRLSLQATKAGWAKAVGAQAESLTL